MLAKVTLTLAFVGLCGAYTRLDLGSLDWTASSEAQAIEVHIKYGFDFMILKKINK